MATQSLITVPSVTLTLDQLLTAIKQLDEPARVQIAKTLLQTEMDNKLSALIRRLAKRQPPANITDQIINAEVKSVRKAHAQKRHAQSRH
jgi:hypothetical protein